MPARPPLLTDLTDPSTTAACVCVCAAESAPKKVVKLPVVIMTVRI